MARINSQHEGHRRAAAPLHALMRTPRSKEVSNGDRVQIRRAELI